MKSYDEWAAKHPAAARDLQAMLGAVPWPVTPPGGDGKSEAWAQQQVRLQVAHAGGGTWRNNVGATKARCVDCGAPQDVVRYGLANDSEQLNRRIKSADLICCVPQLILPGDVGKTWGRFVSIEVKRPGWVFSGTDRENAQMAWAAAVTRLHGIAMFSTGAVKL